MRKTNLTDFYNHTKLMEDVREGNKIINSTDFRKFEKDCIKASKKYKVGDIVRGNYKITKIESDGTLVIQEITKTGKFKKNSVGSFVNPIHL